jgi:Mn2+/Fe2+ NRAMP family transporter
VSEATKDQIKGAFGTVKEYEPGTRRGTRARLLTLLAIIGPGLIVMVGDNDAGGVSTYAQAGQNFGYTLLWTLPLLIPVLIVNQEMVVRLGAVTGIGHGRLIRERIGRRWGNVSICSILLAELPDHRHRVHRNLVVHGVLRRLGLRVGAHRGRGALRRDRDRFVPALGAIHDALRRRQCRDDPAGDAAPTSPRTRSSAILAVPGIRGGTSSAAVLLIISIIGTTVAPWQLYFQQSNIVDKKISPRWMNYERIDTILGSFIVVITAALLMGITAAGLSPHGGTNGYVNALSVAHSLTKFVGHDTGDLFAIVLLNASIIGAAAVTLASSYAVGDLSNRFNQGLNVRLRDAKGFYSVFGGLLVVAGIVVLLPHAPLGLITLAVQAMCGLMLPSTSIFVLLMANDREALGPWVNARWLNALAVVIIAILVVLSVTMMVSTLFTSVNVVAMLEWTGAIVGVGVASVSPSDCVDKARVPPTTSIALTGVCRGWRCWSDRSVLGPAQWLLMAIGTYLGVAGTLLVVRIIQLATS